MRSASLKEENGKKHLLSRWGMRQKITRAVLRILSALPQEEVANFRQQFPNITDWEQLLKPPYYPQQKGRQTIYTLYTELSQIPLTELSHLSGQEILRERGIPLQVYRNALENAQALDFPLPELDVPPLKPNQQMLERLKDTTAFDEAMRLLNKLPNNLNTLKLATKTLKVLIPLTELAKRAGVPLSRYKYQQIAEKLLARDIPVQTYESSTGNTNTVVLNNKHFVTLGIQALLEITQENPNLLATVPQLVTAPNYQGPIPSSYQIAQREEYASVIKLLCQRGIALRKPSTGETIIDILGNNCPVPIFSYRTNFYIAKADINSLLAWLKLLPSPPY